MFTCQLFFRSSQAPLIRWLYFIVLCFVVIISSNKANLRDIFNHIFLNAYMWSIRAASSRLHHDCPNTSEVIGILSPIWTTIYLAYTHVTASTIHPKRCPYLSCYLLCLCMYRFTHTIGFTSLAFLSPDYLWSNRDELFYLKTWIINNCLYYR